MRQGVSARERQADFVARLRRQGTVRLLEAHNGLSALVAQSATVDRNGDHRDFDGFWISSLTDSASRGLPDVEIVGNAERLETVNEICAVTNRSMIVDGDTGGVPAQVEHFVHQLVRAGCAGVVFEDKRMPKRNSLDTSATQHLEDPALFAQKIARAKDAAKDSPFLVIARLESLIAGAPMQDAVDRARRYIEAGADGIMVHSKQKSPEEVLTFAERYETLCRSLGRRPQLVCVPTTYNLVLDTELFARGFNIVIHANHLLRAAHKAMEHAARSILENDRSFEASALCSSLTELFAIVGYDALTTRERQLAMLRVPLVVAGGADAATLLAPIDGKPLVSHQVANARTAGVAETLFLGGPQPESVHKAAGTEGVRFVQVASTEPTLGAKSLFALEGIQSGFLVQAPDVLVSAEVLRSLLGSPGDIVLGVDRPSIPSSAGAHTEVVVAARMHGRRLRALESVPVLRMTRTSQPRPDAFEFAGVAYVSGAGAAILRKVLEDSRERHRGSFHQAESVDAATLSDLLQECIDLGFEVSALELPHGWMHIRSPEDAALASERQRSREATGGTR